jgi:hypothetical protein
LKTRYFQALLPEHFRRIQDERPIVVLSTVDCHGRPHTAIVSWLIATSPQCFIVALDHRGRSFENLGQNSRVALEILGDDLILSIGGAAEIVKEQMDAAPFQAAQVKVTIDMVVDQMVAGMRFKAPSYNFEEGKSHRIDVERRVFEELAGGSRQPLRVAVMADEVLPTLDD